ncbi:MAG: hypothetical protein PHD76_10980 [Methylacidiphilales bacterium]|nr:hypothetical protein [Candidatus Methylacidiphilales bacterium]
MAILILGHLADVLLAPCHISFTILIEKYHPQRIGIMTRDNPPCRQHECCRRLLSVFAIQQRHSARPFEEQPLVAPP